MLKYVIAGAFETAYREGVMLRVSGHNIILSPPPPPLVISRGDVSKIVSAIGAGLEAI